MPINIVTKFSNNLIEAYQVRCRTYLWTLSATDVPGEHINREKEKELKILMHAIHCVYQNGDGKGSV